MSLLQAENLSFGYYQQHEQLFSGLDFQIAKGSRIGLIGANGAGKSTLLALLRGELMPDKGRLWRKPDLKIGWLPQDPLTGESGKGSELIWALRPDLVSLRAIFLDPAADPDAVVTALERYEARGGYRFEQRIDRLMEAFGWSPAALEAEIDTFSGGEKTRLALLRLALDKPDLLLLDEPTNHLDQPMLDWLEDFLVTTPTPWLMVSHDRHVLEGCVETIWSLEAGVLSIQRGNYSSWLREREHARAHQQMVYERQVKKVKQLEKVAAQRRQAGNAMESFKPSRSVRKNGGICARDEGSIHARARPKNVMKAAMAAESRAERTLAEALEHMPTRRREISLIFRARPLRARQALTGIGLSLSRGGKRLFRDLNLLLSPGERLAITGANGSGKTSLLELLAGRLSADQGNLQWAEGARIGYFRQDSDGLDGDRTVLESVLDGDAGRMTLARTLLACLGIRQDQLRQPVSTLSSGERGKVSLAALVAAEPEILLLDEPTNHLELPAREALEAALAQYPGTLIFVSHDRWFREAIAGRELALG